MALIVTVDYVNKLTVSLKALADRHVLIGFPQDPRDEGGELNNAQIAYIHEYGSPARNIPARPFLVPGIKAVVPAINVLLMKAAQAHLDGDDRKVNQLQHALGLLAVSAIRDKIRTGPFAPLSEWTLALRRAKGRQPPYKPLIDTGQMMAAVRYIVRQKKGVSLTKIRKSAERAAGRGR